MVADNLFVSLVSDLNKTLDSLGIEGVEISLVVIPRRSSVDFDVSIPFCAFGFIIFVDELIASEEAVFVKDNIVAGDEPAFACSAASLSLW